MDETNFEGLAGRECGEHRTTGRRAWCHDCTEWCYPDGPCKGCEMPQLRARAAELEAEVETLRAAIQAVLAEDDAIFAEWGAGQPVVYDTIEQLRALHAAPTPRTDDP